MDVSVKIDAKIVSGTYYSGDQKFNYEYRMNQFRLFQPRSRSTRIEVFIGEFIGIPIERRASQTIVNRSMTIFRPLMNGGKNGVFQLAIVSLPSLKTS